VNTQFIYNLQGNTQLTRRPRLVTKATDPRGQAIWSLADLFSQLSRYAYEVYDIAEHPALGTSPRQAYVAGFELTGQRLHRMVRYDQQLMILTMPTTRKGSAKVLPSRGVKIRNIYYWSERFRDPCVEGRSVEVRYNPFDAGTAYAFVRERWEECYSECFDVFRGRSEKEVSLASEELRRVRERHSRQRSLSARQLAVFLESVEAQEALLVQRWFDRENQSVRDLLDAESIVRDGQQGSSARLAEPVSKADSGPAEIGGATTIYGSF